MLPIFNNIYTSRGESKKKLNIKMKNKSNLSKTVFNHSFRHNKNLIDMIKSRNKPLFFLSTSNKNNNHINLLLLKPCEKNRYQKIMEIFLDIKKQIEMVENPSEELKIIKDFLIENDINDKKYFCFEKLNNFLIYIKGNFEVDFTKNLKYNVIDILDGKYKKKEEIKN